MKEHIQLKRVYEPQSSHDGVRVLVDRVWPRGLTKSEVRADYWMKELAPSTSLRKWFGHEPAKWGEFKQRYKEELAHKQGTVDSLLRLATEERITLLYSARDVDHNQARALRGFLLHRLEGK